MHRQLKFVIWFPIVLVAAFAAGYLFWQKTLIPGPYDLEPVSIVRHQIVESLDTSGWQTYRNEKYGFEVRYPAEVLVSVESNYILFTMEKDAPFLNLSIGYSKSSIPHLDSFVSKTIDARGLLDSKERIDFHDVPAIKAVKRIVGPETMKAYFEWIALVYEGREYLITISWQGSSLSQSQRRRIDQILSTFKFVEPTSKEDKVCIQVITPARNPQTGETRDFPTPCDVPENWEIIK